MKAKIVCILFLLVIAADTMFASGAGIKPKVPQAVLDAFKAKYPLVKDIEWEKEGDNYEAEFEMGKSEYEASFTATGQWLETEQEVGVEDLPAAVYTAFNTAYPNAKKVEIEKIETHNQVIKYKFEFKEGRKKKEVVYDSKGELMPDDDNDDEKARSNTQAPPVCGAFLYLFYEILIIDIE